MHQPQPVVGDVELRDLRSIMVVQIHLLFIFPYTMSSSTTKHTFSLHLEPYSLSLLYLIVIATTTISTPLPFIFFTRPLLLP